MDGDAPDGEPYFAERPHSAHRKRELRFLYRGTILTFATDAGVFGSAGLDPGSALLIECLDAGPEDRVLDLGCGWGPVGIAAARSAVRGRVVLTDVNRRAAALARGNLRRNEVKNAEVRVGSLFAPVGEERFDLIASNPPFHAGRETILKLLAEAPAHLSGTGRLLLVGKGSQGILFYQKWLAEHWAPTVTVRARQSGYRVIEARSASP